MRILLADDHQMVRDALASLLEREGFKVVAKVGNGRDAVSLSQELDPDVAVLDLRMPVLNGLDAGREILQSCPTTRVILLTMHAGEGDVASALRAGLRGYLLKTQAADDLIDAIRAVAAGQTYLSPGVAGSIVAAYLSGSAAPTDPLTSRERTVLQLVAEGKTSKEIAVALNLSVKTVESYRARLMQKLAIRETAGLVRYAIRHGLVDG